MNEITSDYLADMYYNTINESNFIWIMHIDTFKKIRHLKDAFGMWIWKPGSPTKYTYGVLFNKIVAIDNSLKNNEIKTAKI